MLFIKNFILTAGIIAVINSSSEVNTSGNNIRYTPDIQDTLLDWRPQVLLERLGERNKMVNEISNHYYIPVKDPRVKEAMRKVPRHKFVPQDLQSRAYDNTPLPIGYGQTISQPLIVAHMTNLLEIAAGEKILEIGTGSGYQSAILSELTKYVYTIEIVPELANQAASTLMKLGYNNIKTKIGDGHQGWKENAPYDGIIVTCAPEDIPAPLIDQLRPGGVIVIPVGEQGQTQMLVVVRKAKDGRVFEEKQFPVRFVPMTGKSDE